MRVQAVCLAGPTASGKSALAQAFAAQLGRVEIVSVDSAQVYRGMDIGTAKPGAAERAACPHHLIDILDPAEAYSAARFAADAQRIVGEIRASRIATVIVDKNYAQVTAITDRNVVLVKGQVAYECDGATARAAPQALSALLGV